MVSTLPVTQRPLIGAVEAAKRLGISRKTLYRYTLDGTIKAANKLPSGVYRYDPIEIERLRIQFEKQAAVATG